MQIARIRLGRTCANAAMDTGRAFALRCFKNSCTDSGKGYCCEWLVSHFAKQRLLPVDLNGS